MSHDALNQEQFEEHLGERGEHLGPEMAGRMGLHPALGGTQVPEVATGRMARHIMNAANVRQTAYAKPHPDLPAGALVDAPHVSDKLARMPDTEEGYRPHHEQLWTSQDYLHVPTLRSYATGGIPAHDPYDEDAPYEPETYEHGGKRWIAEGHHRTVATRLAHRYD